MTNDPMTNDPDELERELEAGAAVLRSDCADPTPTTSIERVRTESKNLRPGTVLVWRGDERGTMVTLKERKADELGWWCVEGGGLADWVLDSPTSLYSVAPSPPSAERVAALEAVAEAARDFNEPLFRAKEVLAAVDLSDPRVALVTVADALEITADPAERLAVALDALATLDEHA